LQEELDKQASKDDDVCVIRANSPSTALNLHNSQVDVVDLELEETKAKLEKTQVDFEKAMEAIEDLKNTNLEVEEYYKIVNKHTQQFVEKVAFYVLKQMQLHMQSFKDACLKKRLTNWREEMKRANALKTIQSVFRGFVDRKRVLDIRRFLNIKKKVLYTRACQRIQSVFRGISARNNFTKKLNACEALFKVNDLLLRDFLKKKFFKKLSDPVKKNMQKRMDACKLIQSTFRAMVDRKKFKAKGSGAPAEATPLTTEEQEGMYKRTRDQMKLQDLQQIAKLLNIKIDTKTGASVSETSLLKPMTVDKLSKLAGQHGISLNSRVQTLNDGRFKRLTKDQLIGALYAKLFAK